MRALTPEWVSIRVAPPRFALEFAAVRLRKIQLALLLACTSLLAAQTRKPSKPVSGSSSKLISIKVTGSKRYTQDDIIAATGLQVGQTVSEDDFKLVSQHLGETGAFGEVTYSFQFSPEGMKLELNVTDTERFVAARFDNFVWLSDQELFEKLHARVPLFHGQLPGTGNLADQVSDALQDLALERKLQGRADYLRSGPEEGPVEAFDFSITGQDIRVRNIGFSGASPAELPQLEAAARKFSGQEYSRSKLSAQSENSFLPLYRERGYLKAAISEPQPKVVQDSPEETVVDVIFRVTPGQQYKLNAIQLSGDKLFPAEKLREIIHLQFGHPANAAQLEQDLQALKKLYGTRGYMAVQIQPTPEMNDAESTVKYVVHFNEGSVYKMGDLEIRGLDSRATERMAAAWKLRTGDAYDSTYSQKFLDSTHDLLAGGVDQWNATIHETLDDTDKVVDVSIHFELKR